MSKWDGVQRSFQRGHRDLFSPNTYQCEFYNHSIGTYDPSSGQMTGQTRGLIASEQIEIVPPAQDSTVSEGGTEFDWDTSIRFPLTQQDLHIYSGDTYTVSSGSIESYQSVTIESGATLTVDGTLVVESITNNGTLDTSGTVRVLDGSFIESLRPLGESNEKPTEVEILDDTENTNTVFELHSYTYEKGSGFVMCRLVE